MQSEPWLCHCPSKDRVLHGVWGSAQLLLGRGRAPIELASDVK